MAETVTTAYHRPCAKCGGPIEPEADGKFHLFWVGNGHAHLSCSHTEQLAWLWAEVRRLQERLGQLEIDHLNSLRPPRRGFFGWLRKLVEGE